MTEPVKPTRRKRPANKGVTVKTTPEAIETREKGLRCIELRKAGEGWQSIADTVGYASPGAAYNAFMRVMREYPREDIETARDIIADRHEACIRAMWPEAMRGKGWAVDRVTRSLEALAKLWGVNRPEKLEISAGASELDVALRELEAEVKARAQGQPVPQE